MSAYSVKRVQKTIRKSDDGPPARPPTSCPECRSTQFWKDGIRKTRNGHIQRYVCRECGFRFSGSSLRDKNEEDYTTERRVCVSEGEMKNLTTTETRTKNQAAGATKTDTNTKSLLFNFAWWMKKEGYAESTINGRTRLLKILAKRGADLHDPETIKETIAKQEWCEGRKENAVYAYTCFLKMTEGEWNPPRYHRIETLPWIPTENEVDQLIAGCSKKKAAFLQLLKETGMRPGEAWKLKWTNLDSIEKSIRITPEKRSNPRILKLSNKLIAMLKALPQNSEYIFRKGRLDHFGGGFRKQRKRTAAKLKNPRIDRITFKTLRHFKATMEYHKTKSILHVMNVLDHKSIKNTLVYTHLVDFQDEEYVSQVAKTAKEAQEYIEAGFDYVLTTPDDLMLFRKRK